MGQAHRASNARRPGRSLARVVRARAACWTEVGCVRLRGSQSVQQGGARGSRRARAVGARLRRILGELGHEALPLEHVEEVRVLALDVFELGDAGVWLA